MAVGIALMVLGCLWLFWEVWTTEIAAWLAEEVDPDSTDSHKETR
jgi:hypothetical protein